MSPSRLVPTAHTTLLTVLTLALAIAPTVKASDSAEHAPAPASARAQATAPAKGASAAAAKTLSATKVDADAMQGLREKLAQKLGATKAPDQRNPNLVRVLSRTADEHAAPAKPSAKTMAAPRASSKAMAAANAANTAPHAPQAAHWSYGGEAGPKAWGGLKPEFTTCAVGTRQSPIDIRGGISVDLEPVQFDYRASSFRVIDNGHTVQVNMDPGNTIVTGGRRFELLQFHFHRPAEERIDGRSFDMVAHLVHKDSEGRLAVVAVLLDRGSVQPLVQTVWNNLPLEKGEEVSANAVLDLNHLLPADRGYYTYMGSLTTPPCSEGVLWMVMRQPVSVSAEQIAIFSRMYPMNARPVQQASGRMIKQSN